MTLAKPGVMDPPRRSWMEIRGSINFDREKKSLFSLSSNWNIDLKKFRVVLAVPGTLSLIQNHNYFLIAMYFLIVVTNI